MKVFVYYNLHRKLWSIRALEGPMRGRVVAHRGALLLRGVTPKVSQAGRERVIREGRKNVHAGLVGIWDDNVPWVHGGPCSTITYNPYRYTGFVHKNGEAPYTGSAMAFLSAHSVEVSI